MSDSTTDEWNEPQRNQHTGKVPVEPISFLTLLFCGEGEGKVNSVLQPAPPQHLQCHLTPWISHNVQLHELELTVRCCPLPGERHCRKDCKKCPPTLSAAPSAASPRWSGRQPLSRSCPQRFVRSWSCIRPFLCSKWIDTITSNTRQAHTAAPPWWPCSLSAQDCISSGWPEKPEPQLRASRAKSAADRRRKGA